ncbi:transcriptional regulator [Roseomonas nepalensis]|uniref:Transcriptional regulator n=1 Tax=Muricoccus nepalensis TaxID=1854500 RepID=A0A502F8P8_9PROT|nr:transcriptional regulator [Roseomonas nepalensis]TPG45683.1 transcriptional regulator [Roseomonas nepalensis]
MVTKTYPWDPAEALDTPAAQAEYLSIVFADGEAAEVSQALSTVARAQSMASGAERESPALSLLESGSLDLCTLLDVIRALGMRLKVIQA